MSNYQPQVDDYVKWKDHEGWVYFKCEQSISIEIGVKDVVCWVSSVFVSWASVDASSAIDGIAKQLIPINKAAGSKEEATMRMAKIELAET